MTIEDKETKRQSRLFQSCLREELSSCTHLTSEEERERDADFCINSANQKLSKVLNWFELKCRRIQTLPVFLTLSLSLSLSFSLSFSLSLSLSRSLSFSPSLSLSLFHSLWQSLAEMFYQKSFSYSFWFRDFFPVYDFRRVSSLLVFPFPLLLLLFILKIYFCLSPMGSIFKWKRFFKVLNCIVADVIKLCVSSSPPPSSLAKLSHGNWANPGLFLFIFNNNFTENL